jgi:D-beta-D-heptose 7-phosphate kinase/D-beta-D-heptose 1-phosphate adenosyltransferase
VKGKDLVARLAGRRVAVCGDAMLDEYVRGRVSRISPEAPVPVVEATGRTTTPGGAANVAMNVAAAGGRATLFGAVGDDEAAKALGGALRAAGVEVRFASVKGRPTTRKTRIIAGTQQVARLDEESTEPLPEPVARRLRESAAEAVGSADGVVLSDYDKGVIDAPLLEAVIGAAGARGVPVVVDPNVTHFFRYKGATVLTPNVHQLERVTGRRFRTEDDVLAAGRDVVERLACGHLLVTRGDEGMTIISSDGAPPRRIAARAREVYDVTGAGDTVAAILALALAAGAGIAEAAEAANAAAGVVVGKRGTAACSAAELRAALGTHG